MHLVERPVLHRLACRVAPPQVLHPDLEDQAVLRAGLIDHDDVHTRETRVPLAVHAPGLAARSPPIDGSDGVAAADAQRGQLPREVGTPRAKLVADQDGGGIRHPRIEGGALVSRACRGEVRPDAALRRVEHGPDDEGPRGERYDRDDDDREGGSADHASARSIFSAASTPSCASNTADPATATLAPASTNTRTLSSFTPQSTSH